MKENSIEEDIKKTENYLANSAINDTNSNFFKNGGWETVDLEIPKAMQHILSDYKRVLKENKELENITDKMIDYIMIYQQVKTMRKIFCKHCKLQNSCTHSGIHRNCVMRYFEYISKQGNINEMHEELEKILESEE